MRQGTALRLAHVVENRARCGHGKGAALESVPSQCRHPEMFAEEARAVLIAEDPFIKRRLRDDGTAGHASIERARRAGSEQEFAWTHAINLIPQACQGFVTAKFRGAEIASGEINQRQARCPIALHD